MTEEARAAIFWFCSGLTAYALVSAVASLLRTMARIRRQRERDGW